VLRQAVQGIADIITTPGIINRDFSDIRAIMLGMGFAMMGSATAKGENALVEAARQAINCALLEEGGVKGARGILINITGSSKLSLHDVNEACSLIRTAAEYEDVQINFGIVLDESLDDEVKITVIATGFQRAGLPIVRSTGVDQVLERATDPRYTSAPEPESVETDDDFEVIIPDREVAEEEVAVAAVAASPNGTSEESKNDLDLPAFMRRERRLFQ
jgi:cell division protein FtsZ